MVRERERGGGGGGGGGEFLSCFIQLKIILTNGGEEFSFFSLI